MLTTIKIVGFVDADGQLQLTIVRYPTEVIYMSGAAHVSDQNSYKGEAEFSDEARHLRTWCTKHGFVHYFGEYALELNTND